MTEPDELGLSGALDTLRQIDAGACAALLDHHALQLSYLVELLADVEEVTWLHPAELWIQVGPPRGTLVSGVLAVTDERLIFLPLPQSRFPPVWFALEQLRAVSVSPAGARHRLDVSIGGTTLVLLVAGAGVAEATQGVLSEYLPDDGPRRFS